MYSRLVVLLTVSVLVGAGAVAAGQLPSQGAETNTEVSSHPPEEPIPPGQGVRVPVEVTYNYQRGSALASRGPTDVLLSVRDHPSWSEARFPSWRSNVTIEATETNASVTAFLEVIVDEDAPDGARGHVAVEAFAAENDGVASSSGSTTVPIQTSNDGSSSSSGALEAQTSSGQTPPSSEVVVAAAVLGSAVGLVVGRRL
jgi:hypothetical protein